MHSMPAVTKSPNEKWLAAQVSKSVPLQGFPSPQLFQ